MSDHPDVDAFVERFIQSMRAPLVQGTQWGHGGRVRTLRSGERILRAPDGTAIRVTEDIHGGTQVEQPDRLHAVIRPSAVQATMRPGELDQ